jgi:hypothetical protein
MRRSIVFRVHGKRNRLSKIGHNAITVVTASAGSLCYTSLTLFPRFARDAVVPRWIRFISAFPARRLIPAFNQKTFNQKLNVSGMEASRVFRCNQTCISTGPSRKNNLE